MKRIFSVIVMVVILATMTTVVTTNTIPDADDNIPLYTFEDINRWMPLVYYDEIKSRNTPEM